MPRKSHTVSVTADEARGLLASGGDRSDWQRVNAMSQAEVERLADEDDGVLSDDWENTVILGVPEAKQDIHIRLDPSVLRWFKAHGPGYQTRINAVLRAFVQARQREERGRK